MWLAREYKANKLIIRSILKEAGVKEFRGRKGIRAWNKGANQFTDERIKKWAGEYSPYWKGGISPMVSKVRRCAKYKQWVKDIFSRDEYTCRICNKKGGWLQADHYPKMFCDVIFENKIKTFEDAINCQELWSLENGRTLCRECHQKTFIFKGNQFKVQGLK